MLLSATAFSQNPTNFPYGIKNLAAAENSTPTYFVTQEVDGVHKKTPAASISTPDATTTVKGKIQLAGDLSGTADAPTVPALANKADLVGGKVPASQLPITPTPTLQQVTQAGSISTVGIIVNESNGVGVYGNSTNGVGVYGNSTNGVGVYGNSTNGVGAIFGVENLSTKDITRFEKNGVTLAAVQNDGRILTKPGINPNDAATVSQLSSISTPDATTTVKGKIQLAGDLSGTADAPTVPGLALKADVSQITLQRALDTDRSLINGKNFQGSGAGNGATDANYSNFFGNNAGYDAINAYYSNFFGLNAGNGATKANASNFFGANAGSIAINANYSNFFGLNAGNGATNANASNFFGLNAGYDAINANASNFFGNSAGYDAINAYASNLFGTNAGYDATNANASNFFGLNAGNGATNANYSNFFGLNAGRSFTGNNLSSNNIIIGTNISLPNTTANAINLGGVLFGFNTYSNTSGDPSIIATPTGSISIGKNTNTGNRLEVEGNITASPAVTANQVPTLSQVQALVGNVTTVLATNTGASLGALNANTTVNLNLNTNSTWTTNTTASKTGATVAEIIDPTTGRIKDVADKNLNTIRVVIEYSQSGGAGDGVLTAQLVNPGNVVIDQESEPININGQAETNVRGTFRFFVVKTSDNDFGYTLRLNNGAKALTAYRIVSVLRNNNP